MTESETVLIQLIVGKLQAEGIMQINYNHETACRILSRCVMPRKLIAALKKHEAAIYNSL